MAEKAGEGHCDYDSFICEALKSQIYYDTKASEPGIKDTTSPVVSNLQWLWEFQCIQTGTELKAGHCGEEGRESNTQSLSSINLSAIEGGWTQIPGNREDLRREVA